MTRISNWGRGVSHGHGTAIDYRRRKRKKNLREEMKSNLPFFPREGRCATSCRYLSRDAEEKAGSKTGH